MAGLDAREVADPSWRRSLTLLWLGQVVSHLGDALFLVGSFFLALEVTGSKTKSGLLVAMNLQTAFLSSPVAMAAFYLKGVAPPHVTLNQIFLGMLPFMGIQIIALILLYTFPAIGMWLPETLYK